MMELSEQLLVMELDETRLWIQKACANRQLRYFPSICTVVRCANLFVISNSSSCTPIARLFHA